MYTHFFIKLKAVIFTTLFVKPFMHKCGSKVRFCDPILLTPKFFSFGSGIFIRNNARIQAVYQYGEEIFKPVIVFEDGVSVEQNLHLTCSKMIKIGSGTSLSANVTISDINHPYTDINLAPELQQITFEEVSIGSDCKIYNNVVVLPGAKIGNHCVIGANSVVLGRKYPDFSIIVGSPAKIVRRYNVESKLWEKTDKDGNFLN